MPRLEIRPGWPSAYGMACGYLRDYGYGVRVHVEHNTYQIRALARGGFARVVDGRPTLREADAEARRLAAERRRAGVSFNPDEVS